MPTYDYVCDACAHAFEHFQSMSDRLLRTCPKCGKKKLVRKVGAGAGLIFKGTGFYITDYKKSSSSGAPEGGSPRSGASDTSSSGEGRSEGGAKSDSKSGSKPDSRSDSKAESKGASSAPGKGDGKGTGSSSESSGSSSPSRADSKSGSKSSGSKSARPPKSS